MNQTDVKLVGDVGGTNARFALLDEHQQPVQARTYAAAHYDSMADAMRQYFTDLSIKAPSSAAIAVATRVLDDNVNFTNNEKWSFSIAGLADELQIANLQVINDFTALALSVPHLSNAALRQVGQGVAVPDEPIGVVGPGTGFGVSGIIPLGNDKGQWRALNSEGGHCSASASTPREIALLTLFTGWFGHVSFERFLSGPGLVNIVKALREIDGLAAVDYQPEAVTRDGLSKTDPHCTEALEIFCSLLGSYAGDLSLILGASGGVYVGGGIVPRLGKFFDNSGFRARFEAKGRVSDELVSVPTFVILDPYPGLLGAGTVVD